MPLKRMLREPLVQFLLLGVGIFLVYGLVAQRTSTEPETIVVTQGQIEHLARGFARTWQRPPSADELEGLIREHLREEVYYREATALGLDKDDIIIRRRLRQKLEFISEDVAAQVESTDEQLRAYLKANPEAFRVEPRFAFRQVYLNPERRRESLAHDAVQLLVQLNQTGAKADTSSLGDSFLLEHDFDAIAASEVAKQFGAKFAAQLNELQPGQWQGPVESGYGVHLVYITERTTGRVPALEEIRDTVRREWANVRRLEANERFYQRLLKRYTVTVERRQPPGGERRVMVLVVAFSLGLAGVLTMVGLLFVKGSRLVQRLPRVATWGWLLPAASALVIMLIGIWLTAEAMSRLQR
jgi:PPIC-type PPIASE domain